MDISNIMTFKTILNGKNYIQNGSWSHLIQQRHTIHIIQSQIQCTWPNIPNITYLSKPQPTLAGALDDGRKAVKWATDYMLKAHTAPTELYGQVGLGDLDHDYWGRPEDMTMSRPAFKINTANPGKPASRSFLHLTLSYTQENQQLMQNVFVILSSDTFTSKTIHRHCNSRLFIPYVCILWHCIY
jgi:hypothetical protein